MLSIEIAQCIHTLSNLVDLNLTDHKVPIGITFTTHEIAPHVHATFSSSNIIV